jgi:hypothetical protein
MTTMVNISLNGKRRVTRVFVIMISYHIVLALGVLAHQSSCLAMKERKLLSLASAFDNGLFLQHPSEGLRTEDQ